MGRNVALDAIQLHAVETFAAAAAAFCTFVESEPGDGAAELRTFAGLLAALHVSALQLPDVIDEVAQDPPSPESTACGQSRFSKLPFDAYWDVFEPLAIVPEDPACNSLSDDLADIYRDVKRGAALFSGGRHEAAAWEWRFLFYAHWGNHLVGAQRAIHLWLAAVATS